MRRCSKEGGGAGIAIDVGGAKCEGGDSVRQHFVPRSYLSNFTDSIFGAGRKPGVWQVDLPEGVYKTLTVEAVAARTDYYTVEIDGEPDDFIEEMFGEIEGHAIAVIRKISTTLALPDEGESGALSDFMAIQRLRVPAFRETVDRFLVDATRKISAIATEERDRYARFLREAMPDRAFTEDEIDQAWKFARDRSNYSISFGNEASLQPVVATMESIAHMIADMRWSYVIAPEGGAGFITSDNPVTWVVPGVQGFYGGGLLAKDAELVWPVTRRIAIVGTWTDGDDEKREVDQESVDSINLRTLSRAQRYVFAPTESLAKWAIGEVERRRSGADAEPTE